MRKRYDYRNDYKGWTIEEMENALPRLKDEMLKNIGYCQSNVDNCLKRISYLENKLKRVKT